MKAQNEKGLVKLLPTCPYLFPDDDIQHLGNRELFALIGQNINEAVASNDETDVIDSVSIEYAQDLIDQAVDVLADRDVEISSTLLRKMFWRRQRASEAVPCELLQSEGKQSAAKSLFRLFYRDLRSWVNSGTLTKGHFEGVRISVSGQCHGRIEFTRRHQLEGLCRQRILSTFVSSGIGIKPKDDEALHFNWIFEFQNRDAIYPFLARMFDEGAIRHVKLLSNWTSGEIKPIAVTEQAQDLLSLVSSHSPWSAKITVGMNRQATIYN